MQDLLRSLSRASVLVEGVSRKCVRATFLVQVLSCKCAWKVCSCEIARASVRVQLFPRKCADVRCLVQVCPREFAGGFSEEPFPMLRESQSYPPNVPKQVQIELPFFGRTRAGFSGEVPDYAFSMVSGLRPIHLAAMHGCDACLERLLHHGEDGDLSGGFFPLRQVLPRLERLIIHLQRPRCLSATSLRLTCARHMCCCARAGALTMCQAWHGLFERQTREHTDHVPSTGPLRGMRVGWVHLPCARRAYFSALCQAWVL